MRVTLLAFVLVGGLVAQPGRADSGLEFRGGSPTATGVASIIGSGSQSGAVLSPGFRLRLDMGMMAPSRVTLDRSEAALRRRFSGTMVDFYPLGSEGFHLSAGGRLDNRRKRDLTPAHPLLYMPKGFLNRRGGGLKKFASAMTVGYNSSPGPGLSLGLEAGTLVERGNPASRELSRFARRGSRTDMRFSGGQRMNPVVQASLGYKF